VDLRSEGMKEELGGSGVGQLERQELE